MLFNIQKLYGLLFMSLFFSACSQDTMPDSVGDIMSSTITYRFLIDNQSSTVKDLDIQGVTAYWGDFYQANSPQWGLSGVTNINPNRIVNVRRLSG